MTSKKKEFPGFPQVGSTSMEPEKLSEKVQRYETFLNETLRGDLKKVLDQRDQVYEQLSEYLQLSNMIERIQECNLEGKPMKTQTDLGCNFYMQAKISDTSKIYICVGLGYYLEFTLSEAVKFIEKKVKALNDISHGLTKDAAKIKANIRMVLEGLRELQGISNQPERTQHRDIFS